jgi:hypothetical protein
VVEVSEAAFLRVFLATCLGAQFGTDLVKQYLLNCSSSLCKRD